MDSNKPEIPRVVAPYQNQSASIQQTEATAFSRVPPVGSSSPKSRRDPRLFDAPEQMRLARNPIHIKFQQSQLGDPTRDGPPPHMSDSDSEPERASVKDSGIEIVGSSDTSSWSGIGIRFDKDNSGNERRGGLSGSGGKEIDTGMQAGNEARKDGSRRSRRNKSGGMKSKAKSGKRDRKRSGGKLVSKSEDEEGGGSGTKTPQAPLPPSVREELVYVPVRSDEVESPISDETGSELDAENVDDADEDDSESSNGVDSGDGGDGGDSGNSGDGGNGGNGGLPSLLAGSKLPHIKQERDTNLIPEAAILTGQIEDVGLVDRNFTDQALKLGEGEFAKLMKLLDIHGAFHTFPLLDDLYLKPFPTNDEMQQRAEAEGLTFQPDLSFRRVAKFRGGEIMLAAYLTHFGKALLTWTGRDEGDYDFTWSAENRNSAPVGSQSRRPDLVLQNAKAEAAKRALRKAAGIADNATRSKMDNWLEPLAFVETTRQVKVPASQYVGLMQRAFLLLCAQRTRRYLFSGLFSLKYFHVVLFDRSGTRSCTYQYDENNKEAFVRFIAGFVLGGRELLGYDPTAELYGSGPKTGLVKTLKVGDKVYEVIGVLYRSENVRGRSVTAFLVRYGSAVMVIKDLFHNFERQHMEPDYLMKIEKLGVTGTCKLLDWEVLKLSDGTNDCTSLRRTRNDPAERRVHLRMVFEGACVTLDMFRSHVEFFSALVNIMKTLKALHDAGFVHRDISIHNLALLDTPSEAVLNAIVRAELDQQQGNPVSRLHRSQIREATLGAMSAPGSESEPTLRAGVILDFHYAHYKHDTEYEPSIFDRTADPAFMSLEEMATETPYQRNERGNNAYQHDIESLMLVTMSTCCVYEGPGLPKDPNKSVISEWSNPDQSIATLRAQKLSLLIAGAPGIFANFTSYFRFAVPFVKRFYDAVFPSGLARESMSSSTHPIDHDVVIGILQEAVEEARKQHAAATLSVTARKTRKRNSPHDENEFLTFRSLTEYILKARNSSDLSRKFHEDIKRGLLYSQQHEKAERASKRARIADSEGDE
ncbi:hypothetical protein BV25DRAFT_1843546 [Artomyces pyxidatus]|uniref:Uncharacterized protein n=1 Tax=Artomyces pyxidatus TaxID=48021 RepID=A0ACB8SF90_9AGAM|nr:hypothetical protein BV25DRAFT_1843546 [Artomyces pyxidatus]